MKTRRQGCLIILVIFLGLIIGLLVVERSAPSSAVKNLPSGASEIEEHYQGFFLNGDYQRLLRAKIAVEEVEDYAKKLGATNAYTKEGSRNFPSHWTKLNPWFNPSKPPLYYDHDEGYRILIGWEDGYVYLDAIAW